MPSFEPIEASPHARPPVLHIKLARSHASPLGHSPRDPHASMQLASYAGW
jgi:hypothetical protein